MEKRKLNLTIDNDPKSLPFDTIKEAQLYAGISKGTAFKIREDDPFLWKPGDHLSGTKRDNDHIDWVKVPFISEF